jgi:hypothetical protein
MPTIGNTSIGTVQSYCNGNYIELHQFQAPSAGILTEIDLYCASLAGTPVWRGVIYADAAGSPGALLGVGSVVSPSTTWAWMASTGLNVPLTAGALYWIGYLVGNTTTDHLGYMQVSGGVSCWFANTYANGPANPAPTPGGRPTELVSIYGVYTAAGATLNYSSTPVSAPLTYDSATLQPGAAAQVPAGNITLSVPEQVTAQQPPPSGGGVMIGALDNMMLKPNAASAIDMIKTKTGKGIAICGEYISPPTTPDVATANNLIATGRAKGWHVTLVVGSVSGTITDTLAYQWCVNLANGSLDSWLNNIANALNQINGPTYICTGVEINCFWMGTISYNPNTYIAAARRIYTVIKGISPKTLVGVCFGSPPTPDINTVWGSGGQNCSPVGAFYPGDAYTDFWGMDFYTQWSLSNGVTVDQYFAALNALGQHPSKPYMIEECGPAWNYYPNPATESTWITQLLQWMAVNSDRVLYFMMYDATGEYSAPGGWFTTQTGTPPQSSLDLFTTAYAAAIADPAFKDASMM